MLKVLLILLLLPLTSSALTARSYIVTDESGTVLLQRNADEVRPIASITKLFTSRAAFELEPNELIRIEPEDLHLGRMRSTPLRVGQYYSRWELLELALISSDNVAAMALGRTEQMPDGIVEPSGLNPQNQRSARELAELAHELTGTELARLSVRTSTTIGGRHSTNPLLTKPGWSFHLSKTGFIDAAGGCLVVVFESGTRLLTAVILGSRDTRARWRDLYELRRQLDDSTFASPSESRIVTRSRRGSAGRFSRRR